MANPNFGANRYLNLAMKILGFFALLRAASVLSRGDGRSHLIEAGSKAASRPIAQLKPRKYTALSMTRIRYVRIDAGEFGDFQNTTMGKTYTVEELHEDPMDETDPSIVVETRPRSHQECLRDQELNLPSLPAVALETMRLIDKNDVEVLDVARIVTNDPAIAAKLIKAANSPIYYGKSKVETCLRAVLRLGLRTTRHLVLAFALREVFDTRSKELSARMEALWQHSAEVAAISCILAKELGTFDPAEAQLAGLLHDIGVVPILSYADRHPTLAADSLMLDQLIDQLSSEVGQRLLEDWNFPSQFVTVAKSAEDWWRDIRRQPELVDLVMVAQLLSFLGRRPIGEFPPLTKLPCFEKLAQGRLDPPTVLCLMGEAESQIRELQGLLGR